MDSPPQDPTEPAPNGSGATGPGDDVATTPPGGHAAPRTGVPAVDDALADLADAEQLPLGEQVAVFEETQRRLRRALDEPSPTDPAAE